jgi:Delta3-Delta2-enoyl-CoA isomerase
MASSIFEVEYKGRVAVVIIGNEKKLNALNGPQYFELSQIMREIATHDEVYITFLTAKGRFFSA